MLLLARFLLVILIEEILKWLESTFYGRTRSVSCLTETIKYKNNDPTLKKIIKASELFSFDLDELIKDGLVESIWCKNGSNPDGCNEYYNFYILNFMVIFHYSVYT